MAEGWLSQEPLYPTPQDLQAGPASPEEQKTERRSAPPPKDSEGHCTLVQAIPHHEGLPRLACPRVAGLPPAPPSLSPFLEGQTGREVRGAALTCVYQTQPDAGLGRQEATLK